MDKQQKFTALDLLEKTIEFEILYPAPAKWHIDETESIQKTVRLQRIQGLINAFLPEKSKMPLQNVMVQILCNDGKNIVGFEEYYNSYENLYNSYKDLIDNILEDIKTYAPPFFIKERLNQCIWLNEIYKDLVEYKKKLNHLYHPPYIVLEGGPNHTYGLDIGYKISKEIKQLIGDKFPSFNNILRCCIDPKEQVFSLEELIESYGYPDFDLEDYLFDCF